NRRGASRPDAGGAGAPDGARAARFRRALPGALRVAGRRRGVVVASRGGRRAGEAAGDAPRLAAGRGVGSRTTVAAGARTRRPAPGPIRIGGVRMAIKPDRWIRDMCRQHRMIEPFAEKQVREGAISYGVSSYGYDIRIADEFKVFTNVN